jgi:hypothetical protein
MAVSWGDADSFKVRIFFTHRQNLSSCAVRAVHILTSVLSIRRNDYATTWTVRGSMSGREREIFCFCSQRPNPLWGHRAPFNVYFFTGGVTRGRSMKLTTRLRQVLRFRISGAIPLLPLWLHYVPEEKLYLYCLQNVRYIFLHLSVY